MRHNFGTSLAWSKTEALGRQDAAVIRSLIPGCVSVEPSSDLLDVAGVDYIATLRRGAQVLVDCKTRRSGCSRYWTEGPELALELWSVRPHGKYKTPKEKAKVGWTLCEKKRVDLILFKFDPEDSSDVFMVCYQLLRIAFRQRLDEWMTLYKVDIQDNGRFESEAVFVPTSVVYAAIAAASMGTLPESLCLHPQM